MSRKLPVGGFQWASYFTVENVIAYNEETSEYGYMVEADVECPDSIHDNCSDMPPFPASIVVTDEMKSETTRLIGAKVYGGSKLPEMKKLAPSLHSKSKYICHISTLQRYLKMGGKITKIHRVLKFKQKDWLEPYISFNTQQRINSTTKFKKGFYKLMNNAFFGKTMEVGTILFCSNISTKNIYL